MGKERMYWRAGKPDKVSDIPSESWVNENLFASFMQTLIFHAMLVLSAPNNDKIRKINNGLYYIPNLDGTVTSSLNDTDIQLGMSSMFGCVFP